MGDWQKLPTYPNVAAAFGSGAREVRVRDGAANLLLRRRLVIDVFSITVRPEFRGQGRMWNYLKQVEQAARALGAEKIVLDGIVLTPRIAEKAAKVGYRDLGKG